MGPIVWDKTIASADLAVAPTSVADANVFDGGALRTVVLSAELDGGVNTSMLVHVFALNVLSGLFERTGDIFDLAPEEANVGVFDPKGLVLGFTAEVFGVPTTYSLRIGHR